MSDYIPPNLTKKQQNLQNVNCYVSVHDLTCHCKQPLKHILQQIIEQEPTATKWLATTTADGGNQDGDADIDHFGPGELERLFAEDDDEKEG